MEEYSKNEIKFDIYEYIFIWTIIKICYEEMKIWQTIM